MKIENQHVTYVDYGYRPHAAIVAFSKEPGEVGDKGDKPLLTLGYFDDAAHTELMRGNPLGAFKVVYDCKHCDHPDCERMVERDTVVAGVAHNAKAGPAPVLKKRQTGHLVKPGGYYLLPGEEIPDRQVAAAPEDLPPEPEPQEPVSAKSPDGPPATVRVLWTPPETGQPADVTTYRGVQILFKGDRPPEVFHKGDFAGDLAAADQFLKLNGLYATSEPSVAAFREALAKTVAAEKGTIQ